MEIRNPVIPNAIAGQTNIGQTSRLPVKADRFAVNPNNSKLPAPTDEKPRSRVGQDEKKETRSPVEKTNEEKVNEANKQKTDRVSEQQNPLVLARQLSGQLANVVNEPGKELALQGQELIQADSVGEAEPIPRSIQTYLDTSKINADDSNNKNIDFFI